MRELFEIPPYPQGNFLDLFPELVITTVILLVLFVILVIQMWRNKK